MNPLTASYRHYLFILMIVLFIIGTPLLIGYSKGYRIGKAFSLIETGGIFLYANTANVNIYLDNEFLKRNGTILRNVLVQDLLPNQTYTIHAEKTGFAPWRKDLVVIPNIVTEARVLMLPLPETFVWTPVAPTTTVAIATAPHATTTKQKVIPTPEHTELVTRFKKDLDQFAVEVATTTFVMLKNKRVATTTTTIEIRFPKWLTQASTSDFIGKEQVREREGIVTWLDNGNLYATWTRKDETQPFFFCGQSCKETLSIDWNEPIERYEFFPNRNDVVIVQTSLGIFAVELDDRSERNIQTIIQGAELKFMLDGNTIIVFDGHTFSKTNL